MLVVLPQKYLLHKNRHSFDVTTTNSYPKKQKFSCIQMSVSE